MKKNLLLLSCLLLSVLAGCNSFQLINSEVYNNADLAAYKTFRIVDPSEGQLPDLMSKVDYYNIAAAIRNQMEIRGYKESPTSDLLINIGLTIQKKIETQPAIPPGYYPYNGFYPHYIYPRSLYWQSYYSNAKVITGIYKEGVLSMDFVNLALKQALYSASVSTILENGQAQLRNVSSIDDAVAVLFSKFPVKAPATASKSGY